MNSDTATLIFPLGLSSEMLCIVGKAQVDTSVSFKWEHWILVIWLLRVEDSVFLDIINSVVNKVGM